MSTAVPPMPAEAAQPGLSEPQRIINTFIAPSRTFEDIRRNASWWVPWLLASIVGLALGSVLSKKVNWEQVVRQQRETGIGASTFASLSKEQQDQQVAIGAKFARALVYAAPITTLVGGLLAAAILLAIFNFGFEAEVSFTRSLAIAFYSWLPRIIFDVFAIVTLLLRSDMEGANPNNLVATNPAYFMDYQSTSKFLYGMAASLDVITIWIIVLLGIGFAKNSAKSKLSTSTAITTIAVLYIVVRLGASALGFV